MRYYPIVEFKMVLIQPDKLGFEKIGDTETHFLLRRKPILYIPD